MREKLLSDEELAMGNVFETKDMYIIVPSDVSINKLERPDKYPHARKLRN
mgnify:CR=1 FL=1